MDLFVGLFHFLVLGVPHLELFARHSVVDRGAPQAVLPQTDRTEKCAGPVVLLCLLRVLNPILAVGALTVKRVPRAVLDFVLLDTPLQMSFVRSIVDDLNYYITSLVSYNRMYIY